MSLSLMNKGGVQGSGYVHGISCISMIESPEMWNGDRTFAVEEKVVAQEKEEKILNVTCISSSTTSIGKNSDDLSGKSVENSDDAEEVQSPYKGPLDSMEALEELLPIRRGISRFYNGKSMSFASLADASSTSIKDIAKPENAYMRRRRNLLACSLAWDKKRSSSLKSNGGGVSKRVTNLSRTTLALAVTMSTNSESNSNTSSNDNLMSPCTNTIAASSILQNRLNPQFKDYYPNGSSLASPRNNFSAWRSFSLVDLQQCGSVTASCTAAPNQLDMKPSKT